MYLADAEGEGAGSWADFEVIVLASGQSSAFLAN